MMELELVSYDELAEALGISKRTLRRRWESGRFLEPLRLSPRKLVWRKRDIEAWLESQSATDSQVKKAEA